MKTFYLALDLHDDEKRILEYEAYHKNVSTEIINSITSSGIINMRLYRTGNRLFMIIDANDNFSFEEKSKMDASNAAVQVWETLMGSYQKKLPWSKPDEKWILMDEIFDLQQQLK